jgi:pyruvate/2-oxoglutarate dehydrogenase complex dihydrolipoamide acyltransferase (E2) component
MTERKVLVPQLSGVTGKAVWAKKEGDAVSAGDVVLEVDLDFMRVPVKAPCAGRVAKVLVEEGHDVVGGITAATIAPSEHVEMPRVEIICAACGAMRQEHASKCRQCKSADAGTIKADVHGWSIASCGFKCRACGFIVPLNHLDMDGSVECAKCGLEQAFDVRGWHEAFDFAHGVADGALDGAQHAIAGENAFMITAHAGRPLCETCHAIVEVEMSGGHATVRCKACDSSIAYDVPAPAARMTKDKLRAVLADDHRSDRANVNVQKTNEAIAITCPSCNASLEADAAKFVVCKYCKTTSRIPDRVWFRLKGGNPRRAPMWLAFDGPSHARKDAEQETAKREQAELLEKIREGKATLRTKREAEARAARDREEEEEREAHKREALAARARAEAPAEAARKYENIPAAEPRSKNATRTIAAMIVVFVVFALVVWIFATR